MLETVRGKTRGPLELTGKQAAIMTERVARQGNVFRSLRGVCVENQGQPKLQETVSEKMLGEVERTFNFSTRGGEAGASLSSRTARAPQTSSLGVVVGEPRATW